MESEVPVFRKVFTILYEHYVTGIAPNLVKEELFREEQKFNKQDLTDVEKDLVETMRLLLITVLVRNICIRNIPEIREEIQSYIDTIKKDQSNKNKHEALKDYSIELYARLTGEHEDWMNDASLNEVVGLVNNYLKYTLVNKYKTNIADVGKTSSSKLRDMARMIIFFINETTKTSFYEFYSDRRYANNMRAIVDLAPLPENYKRKGEVVGMLSNGNNNGNNSAGGAKRRTTKKRTTKKATKKRTTKTATKTATKKRTTKTATKKAVRCTAKTAAGTRCKHTTHKGKRCGHHRR